MELSIGKYFGVGIVVVVVVGSWICIHDLNFFINKLCFFVCNLNSPMLRDALKL